MERIVEKVKEESEIPTCLFVLSDMQFDAACGSD
jgi:hypothetical protein